MQRFLVPVPTVSARNAWHDDLPFVQNATKSALQIMSLAAYASETNNNVFCMQFDQNEHFSSFEFSSAGIKIGV